MKSDSDKELKKVDRRRKKYAKRLAKPEEKELLKAGKDKAYELKGSTKPAEIKQGKPGVKQKSRSKSKHYVVAALPKRYKDVNKITETEGSTERRETDAQKPLEANPVPSKPTDVKGEGVQEQKHGKKLRRLSKKELRTAKVTDKPDKLKVSKTKYKRKKSGRYMHKDVVSQKNFGEKGLSKAVAKAERKELRDKYKKGPITSGTTERTKYKVKGTGRKVKLVKKTKGGVARKGDGMYKQHKRKKRR